MIVNRDRRRSSTTIGTTSLNALAAGDAKKACGHFTPRGRRNLKGLGFYFETPPQGLTCESAIELNTEGITKNEQDQFRNAEITNVKVNGDMAGAKLKGFAGTASLRRVDERWRIDRVVQP